MADNTITLQADRAYAARSRLSQVAGDLRSGRSSLDRRVRALLAGGWSGAAATAYEQAWTEWSEGASTVIEALGETAVLVGEAAARLQGSDQGAQQVSDRLRGRLEG